MPRVQIVLEFEGDASDAYYVVNEVLDSGVLQEVIDQHEFDAGPLRVTSATCSLGEPATAPLPMERAERNERGIPLTDWPRLRDHDVALIAEHVGARLVALRADGALAVLSMFTDRQLDIEVSDNGGELTVTRVERTAFGPDVPLSSFKMPCGPLTLAYRIRATILGEPIDYAVDLDRG